MSDEEQKKKPAAKRKPRAKSEGGASVGSKSDSGASKPAKSAAASTAPPVARPRPRKAVAPSPTDEAGKNGGAVAPSETAAKIVVIWNPKSGSSGEDFRAAIEAGLQSRGADYDLKTTTPVTSGGELASAAISEGATHIIACGGDGTVMSIVNGIAKATGDGEPSVTLSIIPGGTANLLATALKIPTDQDAAVAVAVAGEDVFIDLGRCQDEFFALGLGLGLTERLVSGTSAREKERWGRLAYAWAMLRELGARPQNFTLRLDNGRPHRKEGVAVVVANAGEIGGKMRFAPDARMDDGLLDICILRRFYFRDVLRMLIRTLFGDVRRDRAVAFYQAKRVEITSDPPLDLQIDGELVNQRVPLIAEIVPRRLKVRVPIKSVESENFT